MKKIKSITLSVAELSEILAISDPAVREAALKALHQAADAPENIDLDAYLDGPAVVLTIVRKIHRRYEAAKKRAENKAKKQKEAPKTDAPKDTVKVKINDGMVRRLLWLKHNLPQALDALKRIIEPMKEADKTAVAIETSADQLKVFVGFYLLPLTKLAEDYFRTPRRQRPTEIDFPLFQFDAA